MTKETETFAIFANGAFWGTWAADNAQDAKQAAADEIGTDGDTSGLKAVALTPEQKAALDAWHNAGQPADNCPIDA